MDNDLSATDDDTGSRFILFPFLSDPLQQIAQETETPSSELTFDPTFNVPDIPVEESFLASLNLLYDVNDEDISSMSGSSASAASSLDDYSILSLDEVSSSSNVLSSVSEPVSTTVPGADESITSRLKSVLMSRQNHGKEHNLNAYHHMSSINPMHNYIHKNNNNMQVYGNSSVRVNIPSNVAENRPNGSSLRFPPCCVCGGSASGLHYGVNSCEPCKGFFTRYLRKQEEYICVKNDNCKITNRLRGNCSACRLKKCLALGMSRKNSRLGRYSLARRMETIMQVNKLEGKITNAHDAAIQTDSGYEMSTIETGNIEQKRKARKFIHISSSCKVKAANGFSQKLVKCLVTHMNNINPYGEDLVTIAQIKEKLNAHYESFKRKHELFGNMKKIPKDEYYTLRKEFGIEIDRRMMYLKDSAQEVVDVISRYCTFAKQIPHFTTLSCRDQSNLLKSSRYDFFMVLMHNGYHHEHQVFLAHNGVAFHREEVADQFFSRRLVLNVCDMYHRLQLLKLSKEEKALLIAIALVFTDRCVLENPSLVEQMQLSLTQLLRNQLERACRSSASRRFTKIIDCLTVMRESSELYLREYNQLCKDERVIEEVPIMTAMLFEDI